MHDAVPVYTRTHAVPRFNTCHHSHLSVSGSPGRNQPLQDNLVYSALYLDRCKVCRGAPHEVPPLPLVEWHSRDHNHTILCKVGREEERLQ